jgi:hemerythrin superfamily protein
MPTSTQTERSGRRRPVSVSARRAASQPDAIALLKADHREVEKWFKDFGKARLSSRKAELARRICNALKVHTTIEEEILYPAFLEATGDKDLHHEAEVEHAGAKALIQQIEAAGPEDDYFEARVSVLSEAIKHHVKEEEQRGGMFSEARNSGMDLKALGARMLARKEQLTRS